MTLSSADLNSIAELAYLNIDEGEAKLGADVNAIINFVKQLSQIDTSNTAPLFHPLDVSQPLRPDEVTEESCINELAQIASHFEEELYWVPNVIHSK